MPVADPPPLSAPERLARIIDGLCKAVAARGVGGGLTACLLVLLWGRLSRTAVRVRRLGARIAAGTSLVPRHRQAAPRPSRPPPPHLPRGYAWLVRLAPRTAACGSQLQFLLADPEMAALASSAPMRRLLRPLCRMLGVPPPPAPQRLAATTQSPPLATVPAPLPMRPDPPARPASPARPRQILGPPIASAVAA